jgi:hypothetical protein
MRDQTSNPRYHYIQFRFGAIINRADPDQAKATEEVRMPYCPVCRAEYEDRFQQCAVCGVGLVELLPDDPGDPRENDLLELAQFSNVAEAEMIREILETNGIQSIQRGEVDPIGIVSGVEQVTLLVEQKHFLLARELYDAYYAGSGVDQPQPDVD